MANKKVSSMSSNGPLKNYCKVPNKYLIGHVLGGQNGGSTPSLGPGIGLPIRKIPLRGSTLLNPKEVSTS